jgi:mono/diheme cytochrome c family protein
MTSRHSFRRDPKRGARDVAQSGDPMRLDQHFSMVAGPHPRSRRARRRGFAALPSGASRWLKALCLFPCAFSLVLVTACRQDMHDQPKYRGLRASKFFADGSSARPLVEGTVARGTLQEDEAFFTGKNEKVTVKDLPFAADEALLNRGQERFNIYCSPCHDKIGGGNGMVVQRGYRRPPTFHSDRLRQADAGYFFDVITNGFGVMPDYRAQVAPRDRWAIVAYIRALQLSQHAAATDVPGGDPTKVPQTGGAAATPEKR